MRMLLALLFQAVAAPPAPPSAEWMNLPPLRLERPWSPTSDMAAFVREEVIAGRCVAPRGEHGRFAVRVDVVVLVGVGGAILRTVPAAIGCPTVEQFTAGVISRLAREDLAGQPPVSDTWLRTSITYSWNG